MRHVLQTSRGKSGILLDSLPGALDGCAAEVWWWTTLPPTEPGADMARRPGRICRLVRRTPWVLRGQDTGSSFVGGLRHISRSFRAQRPTRAALPALGLCRLVEPEHSAAYAGIVVPQHPARPDARALEPSLRAPHASTLLAAAARDCTKDAGYLLPFRGGCGHPASTRYPACVRPGPAP